MTNCIVCALLQSALAAASVTNNVSASQTNCVCLTSSANVFCPVCGHYSFSCPRRSR